MAEYQAAPPPAAADYPGKTLGLVGMILAIIPCTYLVGLILSIIAYVQSNKVGVKNQKALIGIIVGAVWLVLGIILYASGITTSYMQDR